MKSLMDRQAALTIVYEAIDVVNGLRSADAQLAKSPDLVLVAEGSVLDSLALTTLVLAVERKVKEITGIDIDLFGSDVDYDMTNMRTPTSLVEAILQQVS